MVHLIDCLKLGILKSIPKITINMGYRKALVCLKWEVFCVQKLKSTKISILPTGFDSTELCLETFEKYRKMVEHLIFRHFSPHIWQRQIHNFKNNLIFDFVSL